MKKKIETNKKTLLARIRERSQRDGVGIPVPFDWMPEDQRPTQEWQDKNLKLSGGKT